MITSLTSSSDQAREKLNPYLKTTLTKSATKATITLIKSVHSSKKLNILSKKSKIFPNMGDFLHPIGK